ncbi:MAG: hypothetical protein MRERV_46c021 [Mycoplasmataceae bacterium RV_VA103A]|nr:MAG: hypothetical protein MRERV_46c021 [Mycoplasmataceae bacterium RV_VA103A]
MKEVIILEVNEAKKSQLIQGFLKQKKIDYRILAETQLELNDDLKKKEREKEQLKKRLIADYQSVAQSQARKKEDEIWDETTNDGLE